MLPVTETTIRLFLHVIAATVWVGGQLTLGAVIPALRPAPDDPEPEVARARIRAVARRFQVVAWIAYGILLATGVWNLTARNVGDQSTAWLTTLLVKLACVAVSGAAAAVHILVASPRVRAATDATARRRAAACSRGRARAFRSSSPSWRSCSGSSSPAADHPSPTSLCRLMRLVPSRRAPKSPEDRSRDGPVCADIPMRYLSAHWLPQRTGNRSPPPPKRA